MKVSGFHFILLSALSCAGPASGADRTPQEILERIEHAFHQAKTITVHFSFTQTPDPQALGDPARGSGVLLLKEGNRISLDLTTTFGGKEEQHLFLSDGRRLFVYSTHTNPSVTDAPKDVEAGFRAELTQSGILGAWTATQLFAAGNKPFTLAELKAGDDDKGLKTLLYKLNTNYPGDRRSEARLWYDPKSFRILKRTLHVLDRYDGFTLTENYDQLVLDADIPDEEFKHPERKK